jgi:CRAL/TRIO domain
MRLALHFPVESFTVVFDLGKFGLKNIDLDGMRMMVTTLQNNYPESLSRIFVLDAPLVFRGTFIRNIISRLCFFFFFFFCFLLFYFNFSTCDLI